MRVILLSISKLLTFLGMKWIIYIYSRVDVIYSHLYILVTKQFIMKLPSFRLMCCFHENAVLNNIRNRVKITNLTPELHWYFLTIYFFLMLHLVFFYWAESFLFKSNAFIKNLISNRSWANYFSFNTLLLTFKMFCCLSSEFHEIT